MSRPRIGSLFSGYGGLDMGVMAALGGSVAWHVEFDKAPSKILAHHWPDVPNYGDVTAVDWSAVEPVDIITGGSPCQDLSHAGKRAGMTEGTRSNLWVAMREAIAALRPSLVIWENVRGAYSAAADSDVEQCAGCLGGAGQSGPALRALGRVLGDLSDLGYDAGWHGLRAADIGAPHGRFRVFVVAHARSETGQFGAGLRESESAGVGRGQSARGGRSPEELTLLPSPRATDGTKGSPNQRGSSGDLMLPSAVALLGTPRASEWKGSGPVGSKSHAHRLDRDYLDAQVIELAANQALLPTPVTTDASDAARHTTTTGVAHSGTSLTDAMRLLPTPRAVDADTADPQHRRSDRRQVGDVVRIPSEWGIYADAIARWEALTRPAPPPTQLSAKGNPQLAPAFVEWLMGLPESHITSVPDLSRNDMLKACGNGVVPQQAEQAVRYLMSVAVPA